MDSAKYANKLKSPYFTQGFLCLLVFKNYFKFFLVAPSWWIAGNYEFFR